MRTCTVWCKSIWPCVKVKFDRAGPRKREGIQWNQCPPSPSANLTWIKFALFLNFSAPDCTYIFETLVSSVKVTNSHNTVHNTAPLFYHICIYCRILNDVYISSFELHIVCTFFSFCIWCSVQIITSIDHRVSTNISVSGTIFLLSMRYANTKKFK